jgi:outer membrane protein OmpA-like peptidoglycan-associated protein
MANQNVTLTEKKGLGSVALTLIMTCLLAIGIGGGYFIHEKINEGTQSQIAALSSKVDTLSKELEQTKKIIAERDSQLSAAAKEKEMLVAEINTLKGKLAEKPVVVAAPTQAPDTSGKVEKVSAIVYFDFGKSELREEFKAELDKVVDLIKRKNAALVLEGHTDTIGDPDFNIQLSKDRADAVKNYILSKSDPKKPCNVISIGVGFAKTKKMDIPNKEKRKVLVTAVEDCKGSI